MKKNIPFQAILIAIVQWVFNSPMSAQSEWLSPLQWKSLVQDPQKNLIIRDTVLYQSFDSDNPLSINYTVSGQYDFFYPQEEGIQGASDSRAIRLYPGSTLTIDTLIYPALKMAEIHIPFAFQHVNKEEDIYFTTYFYSGNTEVDAHPYTVISNDCSRYFREVYAGRQCFYRGRRSAPYRLQIKVTKPTSASDGYYCIDSLFLVGNIEQYSLLQQSGTWHDHSLWSHDYTSLRRVALIDADVRINQAAECLHLINNQKEIRLQPEGVLHTRQMTTLHTFAEKGKWYFISFPHDVSLAGIDSRFQLGDASTVTTEPVNNILYIQTYDGRRRAENNRSDGNWTVLSADAFSPEDILLEKRKGYLMAIDETADIQTLSFSSPANNSQTFRETLSVPLEANTLQGGDEANNGWILCGNPYPSAVSLQEILPNPDLDGYVYLYNGQDYEAYPIDSDYAIPAGSAFFVKAVQDTELLFQRKENTASSVILQHTALPYQGKEPGSPSITQAIKPSCKIQYTIRAGKIHIQNSQAGELIVYTVLGKEVKRMRLLEGEGEYALPQSAGMYFLRIISGTQTETVKIKR